MIEEVARTIDWAPFRRQDQNWNGKGSPLWDHFHRTDVTRIASAKNRAREVISVMCVHFNGPQPPPRRSAIIIWLLKDEGDFDIGLTAYRTKKAAKAALISLIRERWEDYFDEEMPRCPEKLIERYNEGLCQWQDSWVSIEPASLED